MSLLIVGCGFVGEQVAAYAAASGLGLALTTRSAERATALAARFGPTVTALNFEANDAAERLAAAAPDASHALVLLTPSACLDAAGAPTPLRRVMQGLAALPRLSRAVLSSSTAVYGERHGQTVTADSPCAPVGAREQRLALIEQHWLAVPTQRVVRLAGLYGPGRIVGATGLRQGQPVDGNPDAWLNLIHVSDAARLLLRCLYADAAQVELGADGSPVRRAVYYGWLAAQLGLRPPAFSGAPAARGGASRRCDPGPTVARTLWRPMFRDFRAGLIAAGLQARR
jgi:nucleoside-diphosphate-sugar epimerase